MAPPDICRRYEKQDSRIRYVRQPHNIGLAPNHNFTVEQARGELFKWASNDDLYGRDLLKLLRRCARRVPACRARPLLDGNDRQLGNRDEGGRVPAGYGLLAHAGAFSEHAVRQRGRRLPAASSGRRSFAGRRCSAAIITLTGPSSPRSPCMARSTRSRTGCTSAVTTPSGPSGPARRCAAGARTWTHAERTG